MALPTRKEVPAEQTWDLSLLYESEEAMYRDAEKAAALSVRMAETYKGKLNTPRAINACLDDLREVRRLMSWTISYCDNAVSVDYYDARIQEMDGRVRRLYAEISSRLSFLDNEIAAQDEAVLRGAIDSATANKLYLRDILRSKPHQLHPETERTLAALSRTIDAPYSLYNMTKLADMKFDPFTADGKEYPLSYGLYENRYTYEKNTAIRRTAFDAFSRKLCQYENVTAEIYNTQVQTEKTLATLRGFPSVFDALLFDQKVPRELYDRQIDVIMEELAPHMRRYARLLKRIHKLDRVTFADLKLAVDPDFVPKVTIPEAQRYAEEGLSVLGEDSRDLIRKAFRERWFDFANNQGKSTGGYCDTPYRRNSYILLTWTGHMSNVFTIVHELGHAIHFDACNRAQSIFDTNVSTYFVEAPSTMNELLMAHHLLKTGNDPRFRRWVLSSMIGDTYYHNCVTHLLEAAYQREVYRIVDAGGSVNAETLNRLMKETLQKFWGEDVEIDDYAAHTWMRQPHYYMGLYSYTYSAGLTVATQVCKRIEAEGQTAVDDWKRVLAAGSTEDPVGLAKMAGVDITTDAPLRDTIAYIGQIVDEIERLTGELGQ